MSANHLGYVRAQGCVVHAKGGCYGPTEAHHVRTAANSGIGMKPPESSAVGLCARHHRALHAIGKRTFEKRHGVDLAAEAKRLAQPEARPRYWWVDAPDDDPVCPLCGGALIDDGGCRDPACPAKGNG